MSEDMRPHLRSERGGVGSKAKRRGKSISDEGNSTLKPQGREKPCFLRVGKGISGMGHKARRPVHHDAEAPSQFLCLAPCPQSHILLFNRSTVVL